MKRILVLSAALLALRGSVASAAGINVGWNLACPTSINLSQPDMMFMCDNNDAVFTVIGSAKAPAGLTRVTAEELVFDLQEEGGILTPWWHLEDASASTSGGCRGTDPTANPVGSLLLTASFTGASTATCKNYWGTSATGGQYYVPGYGGSDRARLEGVFARVVSTAGPLTANVQYYVANISLDARHTVPDPTDPSAYVCSGCRQGVCIVFNSCKFDQPPGTPNGDITVDTQDIRQFVTWQGGYGTLCGRVIDPVRNATWGRVKSLYR